MRYVDEWNALIAGGEGRSHPIHRNIGATARQDGRWIDVRTAWHDRHGKSGFAIESLRLRDVIAGELGLRKPFQLKHHWIGGMRRRCGREPERG